ncbi:hypothetical protein V757_09965 [Pelistega indica]|uniref:Uncharacterized protein n=1 Tax=Pelistega indica TaxID=1414851 RepID=V8FWR3_9BURK|nr:MULTISPECIES: hypothetical protein [Pelistega]ETD68714.1 hypothetical protein V757_09965 [Pelistega indica]
MSSSDYFLHSEINRQFEGGLEIKTEVNNLTLFVCFYLSETDFDALPHIIPEERFQTGHNVHVGELNAQIDVADEMESILANMDDGDTVVFFCEDEDNIVDGLTFINASHILS